MKRFVILLIMITICSKAYAKDIIFVSILPVKFIAEQIAGNNFEVKALVPENFDPHTYEPKPDDMKMFAKAKYYLSIGDNFDGVWLDKLISVNKKIKIVNIDNTIRKRKFDDHESHHENNAEHEHGMYDPHIWTGLKNMKIMAKNILNFLSNEDSKNLNYYKLRYEQFIKEIDKIIGEFDSIFTNCDNKKFLVFHPSWGYFADDFHLHQIAIEDEGGEPSIKHLKGIIDMVKRENIKVMFVQPQINSKISETISKQLKVEKITINPLSYNILDEFYKIKESFIKSCGGKNE
ncbi:MAG: zinc transport system substrate-binding protein [Deferribacteres bacterium]|jgi:zinc transport system substrate-binding protein|nr:zinc transport system substrate-binding protein [Deferribacteres bacterium]